MTLSLAPRGKWSEGWVAFGRPVRLWGSLLSACRDSSSGHRTFTTDRLSLTSTQSRWLAREGTCRGHGNGDGGKATLQKLGWLIIASHMYMFEDSQTESETQSFNKGSCDF